MPLGHCIYIGVIHAGIRKYGGLIYRVMQGNWKRTWKLLYAILGLPECRDTFVPTVISTSMTSLTFIVLIDSITIVVNIWEQPTRN